MGVSIGETKNINMHNYKIKIHSFGLFTCLSSTNTLLFCKISINGTKIIESKMIFMDHYIKILMFSG